LPVQVTCLQLLDKLQHNVEFNNVSLSEDMIQIFF